MRFASFASRATAAVLGLWMGACTCGEPAPRALSNADPADEPSETPAVPPLPARPASAAIGTAGQTRTQDLPPLALNEADQARANEVIGLGGFSIGQSLEQARARCTEVGGELTHVARTLHRCQFAEREGQPRTHVDVALTPGEEPGPVGSVSFVYTSGAGEPLVPIFSAVTGILFERAGPPQSRSPSGNCAMATANLLNHCLTETLVPVQQRWRATEPAIGNAEALREAGLDGLMVALHPAGDLWKVTLTHEGTGYAAAFAAAYGDAEAEQ